MSKLIVIILIFISTISYSQISDDEFEKYYFSVIHLKGNTKQFIGEWDRLGMLTKDADSVRYIQIDSFEERDISTDTLIDPRYRRHLRVAEVNKCKNLVFFKYYGDKPFPKTIDFKKMPNLRLVDINGEISQEQWVDLLSTAKHLKGIKISARNIQIPACISELKHLEYMVFNSFSGSSFPESMSKLPNLKLLDILFADSLINKVIWNIPSLVSIHLQGVNCGNIPSTIENMRNLRDIYITQSEKVCFPPEIGCLDSLELFYLEDIGEKLNFPVEFRKLNNLREIVLANVAVSEFPLFPTSKKLVLIHYDGIDNCDKNNIDLTGLTNLVSLRLECTRYSYLKVDMSFNKDSLYPKGIETLTNLKDLSLVGWFKIKESPNFLPKLPHLINLYLYLPLKFDEIKMIYDLPSILSFQSSYYPSGEEQEILSQISKSHSRNIDGERIGFYLSSHTYYPTLIMKDKKIKRSY